MKLTSPLAPVLASLTATIVFIILNGYAFGGSTQRLPGTSPSSDHVNVLPQVYHQHDSTLFSRDPQIKSGATFATVLWPIIGRVCPPEHVDWVFFILHVVSLTAVFELIRRLAVAVHTGAPSIASAMGGVSMTSGARTPIIATPPLAAQGVGHPAGLLAIILFIVIRISPAAEPTYDTAFYTRGAALPLGLAAILFTLRGRTVWAAVMLILAGAIHAITALQVFCVSLPLALMSPGSVRRNRRTVMLAMGMAMAAALWLLGSPAMLQVMRPGAAWIAMQRAVNGSHLFVDLIPRSAWREFVVCALFLLPALFASAGDPLRRLAAAALIGAAVSVGLGVSGQITGTSVLLQLSPLRGLKLTMILSVISAAVLIARRVNLLSDTASTRVNRISAVAAGAALLALVTRQHYAAIVSLFVMMALGDWAKWTRVATLVAAGAIAAWFLASDASHGWENSTRTSWLLGAGCVVGAVIPAIAASRAERVIGSQRRAALMGFGGFGIALASLAAVALLSIPAQRDDVWVYAARDYPWTQPADPWAEAQRWVASNTPVDSLFLVPPWLEGFRTHARRSEFVEYKMGTLSLFHPDFGQEWASRMALLTPRRLRAETYEDMALNYNALTPPEKAAIVERYGVTHVIVLAGRNDLSHKTVYENALVRIVRFK